ncbi:unnamed protein product [Symbiodinium natans]|uniref:NADP-dependent oxidoreductase domain-containing protein n=1 Tax=Symbiodinium natans TaxID=878477 RepID=A0A812SN65_9DINO|nr:unnamed protein product [Symbiodinium natans]
MISSALRHHGLPDAGCEIPGTVHQGGMDGALLSGKVDGEEPRDDHANPVESENTKHELAEHCEELAEALPLKPLEARRLQREGVAAAERIAGASGSQRPSDPRPEADPWAESDPWSEAAAGLAEASDRRITAKAPRATPNGKGGGSASSVQAAAKSRPPEEEEEPWWQARAEALAEAPEEPWFPPPAAEEPTWEIPAPSVATGRSGWRAPTRAEPKAERPGVLAAHLAVDPAVGAGVSLLWCAREGYRVQDIEEFPGQPELQVGDLIRRIGPLTLHDAGTVEEAERRFSTHFADGAPLEVERAHFTVVLRVRPKLGAGLSLVWFPPEGYLVEAIEDIPGQPGLRSGDVLRRVGAAALGGLGSQSAADRALAGALKDGVLGRVYRPRCDAAAGDLVAARTAASPLWLPSVGVGTWSWGNESFGHQHVAPGSPAAKEAAASTFKAATGLGSYFFDSAPTYGRGFAEESLGHLATTTGHFSVVATKHFPRAGPRDLAAAVVTTAREAAARLQLESVELLQLHRPAEPPCSLEAQADALASAVKAGAAKAVGVCNFSLAELRVVHDRLKSVHGLPLSTCQVELSLLRQLPVSSGLVNGCRELGVTVLAFSPLAMGRLSGRYVVRASFQNPLEGPDGKIDQKKVEGALATGLDIAKNVVFALFDIFKEPPQEATGKDAPGLLALSSGVLETLKGCQVQSVKDGSSKDAAALCTSTGGLAVFFLTHFGDFNSWELAQQLRTALREGRTGSARVVMVGIGSVDSGKLFAEQLDLPEALELYADPSGACHQALGFSTGALPQYKENLNPYFRVFLMLLGVGSPGTIRTVLGGYFGNTALGSEEVSWVDEALKQGAQKGRFPTSVPRRLPWEEKPTDGAEEWADLATAGSTVWSNRGFGETGLRPFELATVRLQNMVGGIIANWDSLKPADDELLVQQGGAIIFDGEEVKYFFRDKGILTYAPVATALKALPKK